MRGGSPKCRRASGFRERGALFFSCCQCRNVQKRVVTLGRGEEEEAVGLGPSCGLGPFSFFHFSLSLLVGPVRLGQRQRSGAFARGQPSWACVSFLFLFFFFSFLFKFRFEFVFKFKLFLNLYLILGHPIYEFGVA